MNGNVLPIPVALYKMQCLRARTHTYAELCLSGLCIAAPDDSQVWSFLNTDNCERTQSCMHANTCTSMLYMRGKISLDVDGQLASSGDTGCWWRAGGAFGWDLNQRCLDP
jgi:TPP-dependent indolepyruvate ferredoxin oxidoreductase alpha subunit